MKRRFIFLYNETELILPVTPPSFEVGHGIKIETVNIHGLGDLRIAGYNTLDDIVINGIFPAHSYDFAESDGMDMPYDYIAFLKEACDERRVLRFIISDTDVNLPVMVQNIRYGEKDGTNDIAYTLSIAEHREAKIQSADSAVQETEPRPESSPAAPRTYTVVYGDTLWSIARRFLGKGSLYPLIAEANNIPNPNILHVGQVLIIPEVS